MKIKQIITLTFLLICSLSFSQRDNSKSLIKPTHPTDTIFKTNKIEIVNKSFDTLVADYKLKQSIEIDVSNIISLTF